MRDLATDYMGLKLKNPLIAGSCGLTNSIDTIRELADQGIGAVVLKSLFEEQIVAELEQNIESYNAGHPGAFDYIREYTRQNAMEEYLGLIRRAKENIDIPVVASINCISAQEWISFARMIEEEGADGLEINISLLPSDPRRDDADYEKIYFDVIEGVCEMVSIPVALKMSRYSSSLANLVSRLSWTGKVAAFVLFNRYYRPDFDIDTLEVGSASVFSTPEEIFTSLRWIALLSAKVEADFAASTGVHDSQGVIKMLLAGANAVQMVSAFYANGASFIPKLLQGLETWMEEHGFSSLAEFRGRLAWQGGDDSSLLRTQYMRYFGGIK